MKEQIILKMEEKKDDQSSTDCQSIIIEPTFSGKQSPYDSSKSTEKHDKEEQKKLRNRASA